MLPVFSKARAAMKKTFSHFLFQGMWNVSPILRQIPFHAQREGSSASYQREDGVTKDVDFKQSLVERKVKFEEAKGLQPEEFLAVAEEMGKEMGQKMLTNILEEMRAVTEEVGNVIECHGQGLSFENFLELSQKIQTDFDSDGRPREKFLMMGKDALTSFNENFLEWEKDPEKRAAMEEVMAKQQADYDEREARRRMVD